ncbi:MAG: TolC family protein, partial [Bacteroidota bacterium]
TEKNNLLVNQAERTNAIGQFLPEVSGFVQSTHSNGNQFIQQQARLINTTSTDLYPEISSNLTLFNGLRNVNNLKQAKSSFGAQQNLIKRTEQDVIFNVAQQYLTVLLDQELVRIARDNIDVQERQLERIAAFVETGITFKGDQYTLEAQIKNLELAEVQAINTQENDKSILAQTLMLDPMTALEIVSPSQSVDNYLIEEYEIEELYKSALANRADLAQFKLLKEAGEYGVQVSKAAYFPRLSAFFRYNSYYNNIDEDRIFNEEGEQIGTEKVSFSEQMRNRNPNTRIGLSLNIPIFSRFDNRTQVIRSKIQRDNAQLNIENLESTIFRDIQTALQNYEAALASYEAASSQFDAAKLLFDTQTERYNVGLGNIIELTTSSNTFNQASVDKAQASYTLLFQKIILDYQTGLLNAENIPLE